MPRHSDTPQKSYVPRPATLRNRQSNRDRLTDMNADFEFAQDGRSRIEEHWATFWKIYLSEERRERVAGRSNAVGPHGGLTIRQLVPMIKKQILSVRPFIRVEHRKPELSGLSPLINNLIDLWVKQAKLKQIVLTHMLKEALIFGVSWGVVDHIFRMTPRLASSLDNPNVEVVAPDINYQGPWVYGVPSEDAFPYPNARSNDDLAQNGYFIRRFFRMKSELVDDPLYNQDEIAKIGSKSARNDGLSTGLPLDRIFENERRRVLGLDINEWRAHHKVVRERGDEIVECIELIANGSLQTMANRSILIREDTLDHPFPVFSLCPDPIPNEIFGKSAFHDARSSIDQRDFVANNVYDNLARLVHQMFKGIPGQYNPDTLVPKPGGVIQVRSIDGLVELQQHDVIRSAFPVLTHLDRDIERGTGVTELLSTVGAGAGTVYPETATVGMQKDENAGMFVGEMVEQVEEGLKKMFEIMFDIELEYLGPDIWVALAGEEGARWRGIDMDTIASGFDFNLVGAEYATKRQRAAENFAAVFDRLLAIKQADPSAVDLRKLALSLLDSFGVENNGIVTGQPKDLGPDAEHRTMRQGIPVEPEIDEDIQAHLQAHVVELQRFAQEDGEESNPLYMERLVEHVEATQKMYERVQQAQELMQQQIASQAPQQKGPGNGDQNAANA